MTRRNHSVAIAAESAGRALERFAAVEQAAQAAHEEMTGRAMVRAMLDGNGLHAVISDGKATLEIANGRVAVSVKQEEPEA